MEHCLARTERNPLLLFVLYVVFLVWWQPAGAGTLGTAGNGLPPPINAADQMLVAVEYYHPALDHYFITADPHEISLLASGQFAGWIATGEKFAVLSPDSGIASSTPVCRYYGDPAKGLNSHFYSGIPDECSEVLEKFADSWRLESNDVFRAYLPDQTGYCPLGTEPVYRLWNNRPDINHRYTTSADVAAKMRAKKYVAEGFGTGAALPVMLCAPVAIACALAATNVAPAAGSPVLLTSACTGNPTRYVWSGCDSEGETCLATSAPSGIQTYGVVASAPSGMSEPAVISIDWKPAGTTGGAAQEPTCSISASNMNPAPGTTIELNVICTVIPTSYTWTGCTSTTNACKATSSKSGSATYSLAATTPIGNAKVASITINWGTGAPTPPPTTTTPSSPGPTPPTTSSTVRTPIPAIPAGEARVISANRMADVWEGPQPKGNGNIVNGVHAWSSGIYAPLIGGPNGSLLNFSGGDADSWDTAVRAFSLDTGLWTRIKNRTTALAWNPASDPQWNATYAEHGDGTPGVPHTYDFLEYLPPEAGTGPKGSLLLVNTRYAYLSAVSNWSHGLNLDTLRWSRTSSGPTTNYTGYNGMSAYDPTTKRVWILACDGGGASVDRLDYLDFSDGSGVGVPGKIAFTKSALVRCGSPMRFWRGKNGTKRYLAFLGWPARNTTGPQTIRLIDLDSIAAGVRDASIATPPRNFAFPGSGFTMGQARGFAMSADPGDNNPASEGYNPDGLVIYDIVPPDDALNGTWQVTARPLNGIALAREGNQLLYKRLEYHEQLGVVTFYIGAGSPVYAYRPPAVGAPVPASTPPPPPAPTPPPTTNSPPTTTPAPPPVLATGTLRATTVAIPFSGIGAKQNQSKNLDFAYVNGRWYKCAGDHQGIDANTPGAQGGRQEILSFTVAANDWRQDTPYFLRSGMNLGNVQIALPDDGACVARNDEIWSFVSERVAQLNTADWTASVRGSYGSDIVTQEMDKVGAWNVTTRQWRTGGPRPAEMRGDRLWRVLWDAQTDRFITPVSFDSGMFLIFDKDGNDISPRGAGGDLHDYGSHDFHSAGILQDGRNGYVYDVKFGVLYRFNLDQDLTRGFPLTPVLTLPGETYGQNPGEAGRGINIVWHPGRRAIILLPHHRTGYAFDVDNGKLSVWDREDALVAGNGHYVHPSAAFYDPPTGDVVSIGTIDFDTGMVINNYWRLHLQ
jgi:hypothetical protein